MNNEPVAWMCKSGFEYQQVKEDFSYKEKEGWVPLYTHPAELTDEEIGQFKGEWYRGDYASFYDLVKAILRKTQEK